MKGVFDRSLGAHHLYERSIDAFLRDSEAEVVATRRLHDRHGDLIGPFDPTRYANSYSGLRDWWIRVGRAERVARIELKALRGLWVAAGWPRRAGIQVAALSLARSLQQDRLARSYSPITEMMPREDGA
jgi:hypothetical protein